MSKLLYKINTVALVLFLKVSTFFYILIKVIHTAREYICVSLTCNSSDSYLIKENVLDYMSLTTGYSIWSAIALFLLQK